MSDPMNGRGLSRLTTSVKPKKKAVCGQPAQNVGPRPTSHLVSGRPSELAGDVGVWDRREQPEVGLDRRITPVEPGRPCLRHCRRADLEGRLEAGGVLAGDGVAVGRQGHGSDQRQRGRGRDILPRGLAEPAGPCATNGRIDIGRVGHGGSVQRFADRIAKLVIASKRRSCQRGEQQDDAEVGVGPGPPCCSVDRGQDGGTECALASAGQRRPYGRCADQKILEPGVVEVAAGRHVSWLWRRDLEQACQLAGDGHIFGLDHRML